MFRHQAKLIKHIRKTNNLTQEDFAKILGVHLQFVSNMERGLCGFPAGRFKKIAGLVTVDKMMKATSLDFAECWNRECMKVSNE